MPRPSSSASQSRRGICPLLRACIICLLGFASLNACILWRVRSSIFEGYGDFASFYTAGSIVRMGQSARLYDPVLQWKVQQEFASKVKIRRGPLPYIRPPFESLLFLPLAYLNYRTAWMVWLVFKVALVLILPFVLPPPTCGCGMLKTHVFRTLICFAFFPVGFDMLQGQDSILLLIILAFSLRLMLRGATVRSGAVMALGLFKFHLIIPLLLTLAFARKGRVVLGFLLTALLCLLTSIGMVRWSGILAYPGYLWRLNRVPGFGMVVKPQSMPNFRGMFAVLLGGESRSLVVHGLLIAGVALGVVIAAESWRQREQRATKAAFSFSIVVILVTSYYANSYDMTLLLLPLLLVGEPVLGGDAGGWPETFFLAVASVLLCSPLLWFLALGVDQVCWIALILFAFAVSIFVLGKNWRVLGPA